jgi:hypothetical protein
LFSQGLIRHLIIWGTLHVQGFNTWIWLSNGNGPALPIEVDKAPPEKMDLRKNITQ